MQLKCKCTKLFSYYKKKTEIDVNLKTKSFYHYLFIDLKNRFDKSLIKYVIMLIKGDIIHQDLNKAKKLLHKLLTELNSSYFLLLGIIMIKEKKIL